MGRPSKEQIDSTVQELEKKRTRGPMGKVWEGTKDIGADVWNIGFEAMPERMYSTVTGVIPESVPYIGGGGERAIETRRILDERSKQGKQIVGQFGATSPENLQFIYDTEKILEKRFEGRPWWQQIGTSFFNPLELVLGGAIGKGIGVGIKGAKAVPKVVQQMKRTPKGYAVGKGKISKDAMVAGSSTWNAGLRALVGRQKYGRKPELDRFANQLPSAEDWLKTPIGQAAIKTPRTLSSQVDRYPIPVRKAGMTDEEWLRLRDAELRAGDVHVNEFMKLADEDEGFRAALGAKSQELTPWRNTYNNLVRMFDQSLNENQRKILSTATPAVRQLNLSDAQRRMLQRMNPLEELKRLKQEWNKAKTLGDEPLKEDILNQVDEVMEVAGLQKVDDYYVTRFKDSVGASDPKVLIENLDSVIPRFERLASEGRVGNFFYDMGISVPKTVEYLPPLTKDGDALLLRTKASGQLYEETLDDVTRRMAQPEAVGSPRLFIKSGKDWIEEGVYRQATPRTVGGEIGSWGQIIKGIPSALRQIKPLPAWMATWPLIGRVAKQTIEGRTGGFIDQLANANIIQNPESTIVTPMIKILRAAKVDVKKAEEYIARRRRSQVRRIGDQPPLSEDEVGRLQRILSGDNPHLLERPVREMFGDGEAAAKQAEAFKQEVDKVFDEMWKALDKQHFNQLNQVPDDILEALTRTGDMNLEGIHRVLTELQNVVNTSPGSAGLKGMFDYANARIAFEKMWQHGVAPSNYSIGLMGKIFGTNVGKELLRHRKNALANSFLGLRIPGLARTPLGKYTLPELLMDVAMLPKTLRASFDASAPLRQGLVLLYHNPSLWLKSFNTMAKLMLPGGDKGAYLLNQSIVNNPRYGLYTRVGGLSITDTTGLSGIGAMEEAFLSGLARDIVPLVGVSERGYVGFLNKLRFDVMENMTRNLEFSTGRLIDTTNPQDVDKIRKIAAFINSATGRGPLPFIDKRVGMTFISDPASMSEMSRAAQTLLNLSFWSPRFLTSRIMLAPTAFQASRAAGGSVAKATLDSAATTLVSWVGTTLTMLFMLKHLTPGVDADLNPQSSSFGKLTIGNTKIDPWAGMGPIVRMIMQIATQERVTASGDKIKIDNQEILLRFLNSKFSPTASTASAYITGTGYFGEDADILEDMKKPLTEQSSLWYQLLVPMFLESVHDAVDTYTKPMVSEELAAKYGIKSTDPISRWEQLINISAGTIPEFFGLTASTYITKDDIRKAITEQAWDLDEPVEKGDLPQMGQERGIITEKTVDAIAKDIESFKGIKRTTGLAGELNELRTNEIQTINNIGSTAVTAVENNEDVTKTINRWVIENRNDIPDAVQRKATEMFFDIRKDFRSRRAQAMWGKKWGEVTEEQIRGMDFKNAMLHRWWKMSDNIRGTDEYNREYQKFESMLLKSKHPDASQGLAWWRMHTYDLTIPDNILILLPEITQLKYGLARRLRLQGFGVDRTPMPSAQGQ